MLFFLIILNLSCGESSVIRNNKTAIKDCSFFPNNKRLLFLDSLANQKDYLQLQKESKKKSRSIQEKLFINNLIIDKYIFADNKDSISYFIDKGDSLLNVDKNTDLSLQMDFAKRKAEFYLKERWVDSCIYYHKKVITLCNAIPNEICIDKINSLGEIAIANVYYGGSLDSAKHYLELQEEYFTNDSILDKIKYKNYYTQATIYRRLQNYTLSLTYVNLAIKILEEKFTNNVNIANTYALKANILYEDDQYFKSLECSKIAINIAKKEKISSNYLKNYYIGIINTLTQLDSTALTEKYIDKLYKISTGDLNTEALTYKLKAINYLKRGEVKLSAQNFEKAISAYKSVKKNNFYHFSETCYLYSRLLLKEKEYMKAKLYVEKAISVYFKTKNPKNEIYFTDPISIKFLSNLAFIYSEKYKQKNEPSSRDIALEYYSLIDSLISYFNNSLDQDVVISNQSYLDFYYSHYFSFNNYLYGKTGNKEYLKNAVTVLSKYKGQALLKERIQNNTFNNKSDISEIKQKIEETKFKLNNNVEKADSLTSILNQELKALEKFKLKPQEDNEILSQIENYSKKNKAIIIDYFMPEGEYKNNIGYAFVTNGNTSKIYSIQDVSEIISKTDSIYNSMSCYSKDTEGINKKSIYLFEKLLFFLDEFKNDSFKSIVIIPDRNLSNIPFELLVSNGNINRMVLEDYDVSYAFSLQNLLLNSNIVRENNKILAFSFSDKNTILNENNDSFPELPGSFNEVKSIKNVFKDNCLAFYGYNSSKKSFLKNASNYSIIHLALHGIADNKTRFNSCLFFRDKKQISPLYPYELMKHKIKPNLMVLSACETASGKIFKQESMFSIAKAFYTSGANKVISSLWQLDDNSSKKILVTFYEIIKENKDVSYSKALRMAKLSYMKNNNLEKEYKSFIGNLILYN